ncbi:hypothetical protein ACFE04_022610 [Oxalis oulophora]
MTSNSAENKIEAKMEIIIADEEKGKNPSNDAPLDKEIFFNGFKEEDEEEDEDEDEDEIGVHSIPKDHPTDPYMCDVEDCLRVYETSQEFAAHVRKFHPRVKEIKPKKIKKNSLINY